MTVSQAGPSSDPRPDRAADAAWFRRVLGQYPTGVSVITALTADGEPVGMAVGSFTSVSLDPPLVAFLPSSSSSTWPKIQAARRFCVNILAADQEEVCRSFASRDRDRFAGLDWRPGSSGAPILQDAVSWIECDLQAVHEAGDHKIVVGEVRDLDVGRAALPLLFFQGGYGRFSPHSLAAGDAQFGMQLQLVDRARPLMETLSRRTGAQIVASYCDGSELTLLASVGTPTDLRAASAMIGQRVPVIAPVGIWWMAFAPAPQVETWLGAIESVALRACYRQTMDQIREHGYCHGLAAVHTEVEQLISRRTGAGRAPTEAERRAITRLALDPLLYAPPARPSASAAHDEAEIVSLWAPTFTAHGEVTLGLMLRAHPEDERPVHSYAGELLELAEDVTRLASTVTFASPGLADSDSPDHGRRPSLTDPLPTGRCSPP